MANSRKHREAAQDCDATKLAVEWVPIERVHGSPSNPRDNDAAVPHVAASIKRFGWQQPVVARADGEVIAGNTRLKAAHHLGLVEVPVVWFSGTDLDAVAYQIADNRTGELATWDETALASMLTALREEDSLEGVGYDADELQQVLDAAAPPVEVAEDEVPEPPADPITKPGDLWLLGAYYECEDCGKTYDYEEGKEMQECPCG